MENFLRDLFDFQRFERDGALEDVAEATARRYAGGTILPLDEAELTQVAAAGLYVQAPDALEKNRRQK